MKTSLIIKSQRCSLERFLVAVNAVLKQVSRLVVCQNDGWRASAPISIDDEQLCLRYLNNPLTESIVFGGLEPLEQFDELCSFLEVLRGQFQCKDDVVIYTGYYFEEVPEWIQQLATYGNVIVKFGRYIPNQKHIFDEVLASNSASDNQ